MVVHYAKAVRKKLKDEDSIQRSCGTLSKKTCLCLSVLKTVDNLGQIPNVPPTERHKLTGDYDGCWAISISKNWRLLLRPLIGTEPNEITEVEIFEIGDYH